MCGTQASSSARADAGGAWQALTGVVHYQVQWSGECARCACTCALCVCVTVHVCGMIRVRECGWGSAARASGGAGAGGRSTGSTRARRIGYLTHPGLAAHQRPVVRKLRKWSNGAYPDDPRRGAHPGDPRRASAELKASKKAAMRAAAPPGPPPQRPAAPAAPPPPVIAAPTSAPAPPPAASAQSFNVPTICSSRLRGDPLTDPNAPGADRPSRSLDPEDPEGGVIGPSPRPAAFETAITGGDDGGSDDDDEILRPASHPAGAQEEQEQEEQAEEEQEAMPLAIPLAMPLAHHRSIFTSPKHVHASWTCMHCGVVRMSVVASTAERWEREGCSTGCSAAGGLPQKGPTSARGLPIRELCATNWSCPHCATAKISVMPLTARRWAESGCPSCPHPAEHPARRERMAQHSANTVQRANGAKRLPQQGATGGTGKARDKDPRGHLRTKPASTGLQDAGPGYGCASSDDSEQDLISDKQINHMSNRLQSLSRRGESRGMQGKTSGLRGLRLLSLKPQRRLATHNVMASRASSCFVQAELHQVDRVSMLAEARAAHDMDEDVEDDGNSSDGDQEVRVVAEQTATDRTAAAWADTIDLTNSESISTRSPFDSVVMEITLPDGVVPGQRISVDLPDGEHCVPLIVPAGCFTGCNITLHGVDLERGAFRAISLPTGVREPIGSAIASRPQGAVANDPCTGPGCSVTHAAVATTAADELAGQPARDQDMAHLDEALAWARVVRFAAAAAGRAEKNIKGAPAILVTLAGHAILGQGLTPGYGR